MTLAPENQLGTQKHVIEEIVRGLEENIHFFVDLKARQLGVTTITLALDLFWHWQHPGMQGTLAADSEENRDMFRSTLAMYYDGLPKSHRIAMVQNNRNFMSFKNRSRMLMQIGGGKKTKGGKGRGKGLTFMHATEVSSWEDEESLASILASLAESNPLRLYLFETTARGFNMFHDIWTTAKRATTQKAIFTGWWRNELYRLAPEHPAYRVYWDGHLTGPEREWVRAVKLQYGFTIDAGQMAWWRWKLAEVIKDDNLMLQEYPPTEELAFILSGKNFFALPRLQEVKHEIDLYEAPTLVRFIYGDRFSDTMLEETIEAQADLCIWEMPDPQGFYSIGADPAYGSSDWADRFAIEVYRCYADRFEQVAEFCTADMSTYRFAWVLMYLSGLYRNTMINLEINGPGQAVFAEMQAIRKSAGTMTVQEGGADIRNFLGHMQYYLFRRMDSMGGGAVYHFKCLALDTMIPTPTGWTTMGALKAGDYVFDEKGNIAPVLESYPVNYEHDCYRITFDDKAEIVCDAEHLWPTVEGLKKACDLIEGDRIKVTEPINTLNVGLLIDPYVLGVWLGDGHSADGRISCGEADSKDMRANLEARGVKLGKIGADKRNSTRYFTVLELRGELVTEGLLGNKHIPPKYLRAGVSDRLALLQGLMDTDGAINFERQCEFVTTSERLRDGMSELLRSLGIKAKYITKKPYLVYKGEPVDCKVAYQFYFTAYPDMPVFKMSRKLERQSWLKVNRYRPSRSKRHIIVDILRVPSVPVRCIKVGSESSLFLAGESMIPTHNTTYDSKEMMMNLYRDLIDRKEAVIKSEELLDEMKIIVREEGFLGASGRAKDDRVIASALSAVQYHQYLKFQLAREGRTYAKEQERKTKERVAKAEGKQSLDTPMQHALGKNVGDYLKAIGMKQ